MIPIYAKTLWAGIKNKRPMDHTTHRRKIFTCFQYHFTNKLLSPLIQCRRAWVFIWKKILIYLTQECFMPSLVETGPVVLKFTISLLSLLREGHGPAFEQTWTPPPKDDLCQVWLKLAWWFWRKFLNIFNIILNFHFYLLLEKDVALHLNKLESPSSKDALGQDWMKSAQWFLRRRLLNIFNIILYFCYMYYLPLEKGVAFNLNKHESPPSKDALCKVW